MIASQSTAPPQLHFFTGFLHAATAHAAEAMSRWTHGQVRLSLQDVRESPWKKHWRRI